jgi:hypothetical protein
LLRKNVATENQLRMSGVDKIDGAMSSIAESDVPDGERLPQHGLARTIALHLIPGAVTTAIYIAGVPAVTRAGYPPLAALLLAFVVGLMPVELGILFSAGKRKNARWSLDGIVLYREKWPISRYFKAVPVVFLICIAAIGIAVPIDRAWVRIAFSWLPTKYMFVGITRYTDFSRSAVLITFIGRLAFGTFLQPVIEEMYFRAYLLPRISRFGGRAVFLNCGLYAFHYFGLLYSLPSLFLAALPIVAATWLTKNYRVGMVTRIVLGLIGGLLGLTGVMHLSH